MTVFNDLQWKTIPTYPSYEVSNLGQVRSKITGKLLALDTKRGGLPYLRATLYQGNRRKHRGVHRLVLEAFIGPCPEGFECLHLDDNPRNNRLDNLKWGTHQENCSKFRRNDKPKKLPRSTEPKKLVRKGPADRKGAKNGNSKLTAEDVCFIRAYTGKLKDLVEMFGLSYNHILKIRSNTTWNHL